MANNNEKKFYTFLATNKCVGKDGATFNDVTAVLNLTNIQVKSANDKKLVVARAAINNRTKLLNSVLGSHFPESDEVVWADVTFWEARADRFEKFIGQQTKARLCVVGTISLRNYQKQDGTNGEAISISVNDWIGLDGRGTGNKAEGAPQSNVPTVNDDDLPY